MNYSLSNMLSNGGSLNADGLSLDLAFALDKTLTARRGPTPTFTRASTATFIGSNGLIQSAAINEPRFDHDPATLECRGLLLEESRQNALLNSDALATQNVTVTAAARTLSFYGTGTVVLSGTHVATVVGTGAYPARTTLTFTPTAGTLTLTVTGTVQFAQLEIGAFPTSYIPTTTTALTRSADVCSITGANFTSFYNQSEGTLFAQHFYSSNNLGRPIHISDGSSVTNVIEIFNGSGPSCNVFSAGSQQYTRGSSVISNTVAKSSLAVATSNAMLCVNGTLATSGGGVMPIGVNQLNIGNRPDGTRPLNGHIARLQYFKKRLPNAKLQTLTTP